MIENVLYYIDSISTTKGVNMSRSSYLVMSGEEQGVFVSRYTRQNNDAPHFDANSVLNEYTILAESDNREEAEKLAEKLGKDSVL